LFHTWAFDIIKASKERKLTTEDFGGISKEDAIEEKVLKITNHYDS